MSDQASTDLLRAVGRAGDDEIPIGPAALALAALDQPGVALGPYEDHLAELAEAGKVVLESAGSEDPTRLAAAFGAVVGDAYGYRGDRTSYDDPQNANLIRVIDRRKGLPVALGILYLHIAQATGTAMTGLSFPGHFLLRLEAPEGATILDPFDGGRPLEAADLRMLLQQVEGPDAELEPHHYEVATMRAVLLRLQNNLVSRSLSAGETGRAAELLERMVMIAPARAELWFELGRIQVMAGNLGAGAQAFGSCADCARARGDMSIALRADEALAAIRRKLN